MKQLSIAMILASLLIVPVANAIEEEEKVVEGTYGGFSLGQLQYDQEANDTVSLGFVLGDVNDYGLGYELFYSLTLVDDSESSGDIESSVDADTLAFYAIFQTPGDFYFKAKAGYAMVFFQWDVIDDGSTIARLDENFEGFSYGLSVGAKMGGGALELSYYRFPDFEDFDELDDAINTSLANTGFAEDVSLEFDIEMINLAYVWTF